RCVVAAICMHNNTYSKYSQYAQYTKNALCCAVMSNTLYLQPDTENISSDHCVSCGPLAFPISSSFRRLFKLLCPCALSKKLKFRNDTEWLRWTPYRFADKIDERGG